MRTTEKSDHRINQAIPWLTVVLALSSILQQLPIQTLPLSSHTQNYLALLLIGALAVTMLIALELAIRSHFE